MIIFKIDQIQGISDLRAEYRETKVVVQNITELYVKSLSNIKNLIIELSLAASFIYETAPFWVKFLPQSFLEFILKARDIK